MKNNLKLRILSFLLALSMVLPLITVLPLQVAAADSTVNDEAQSSDSVYLDGVHYHIDKTVTYIGNRSFWLNVSLRTTLTDTDIVINRTAARNGYFTVEVSGYYLLELWGGQGASVKETQTLLSSNPGGRGGARGYVYAKVYLEAGQTLAYSIGTNGAVTAWESTGGGVNGSGGAHGEYGSNEVGGGGGYSALYFFEEGEFDSSWLTETGSWNMPSSVRLSHYVMIAAGGGGGGAGNSGAHAHATGVNGVMRADGGAGGNAENGVSIELSGSGYAVPGYLFFGKNGKSTGTSTAYVGRAGTNVPGKSPSTVGGEYKAQPGPNDWSGSYNTSVTPGAGGNGMWRGGGGGAGYCGGSGGIMTGSAWAANIGGGGGGSSFLASSFGDSVVEFLTIGEDEIHGSDGCTSIQGGAFSYTLLSTEDDAEINTEYLKSVVVEGQFSKYFDVYANPSTDGTLNDQGIANLNGTMSYDEETGSFKVEGGNIDAGSVNSDGVLLTMDFYVRPKSGFLGGNNVPLLTDLSITLDQDSSEERVIEAVENPKTDFVNVPVLMVVTTNSKMISLKSGDEPPTFKIADLYVPEHSAAYNNPGNAGWQYDFIDYVSQYTVYTGSQGTEGSRYNATETPPISDTTYYSICISATPRTSNGYAECGPKNEKQVTFYGVVTITVLNATVFDGDEWDYDLTAKKTLNYDGTNFIFEQTVSQSLTAEYELGGFYSYAGTAEFSTTSFTATKPGYYLVQNWGADGGAGGSAYGRTAQYGFVASATGGSSGVGGDTYGFVYLNTGDTLTFTLGRAGSNGTGRSHTPSSNSSNAATHGDGGTGGMFSYTMLTRADSDESVYLMIAGGGGGGSGAAVWQGNSYDSKIPILGTSTKKRSYGKTAAAVGSEFNYTDELPGTLTEMKEIFAGGKGDNGRSNSGGLTPGSDTRAGDNAGTPGLNYANTEILNQSVSGNDGQTVYIGRLAKALASSNDLAKPSTSSGAACVSYICALEEEIEEGSVVATTNQLEQFPGVETHGTFSRYFDIATDESGNPKVEMSIVGEEYDEKTSEKNDDGSFTVTYFKDGLMIAMFTYTLVKNPDETISYSVTSTMYHPTFEEDEDHVFTDGIGRYVANGGYTVSFYLVPKEGFLGGNDVPVLSETGGEFSNVYITKGEAVGYLKVEDKADFANVPVNYDVAAHFFVKEGYVIKDDGDSSNDTVSSSDLYDLTIDLSEYEEWQKAYVGVMTPVEETVSPSYSPETVYLTAGVVPLNAPQKAVVSGDTEGAVVTLETKVYVQYPVIYQLENMNHSGVTYVTYGKPFQVFLTCDEGFIQPPLQNPDTGAYYIEVYAGRTKLSFDYAQDTGEVYLSYYSYSTSLTVRAKAITRPYQLHYVYSLEDGVSREYVEEYEAGVNIDYTWMNAFAAPEREGYTFSWEWETDDGEAPDTMPGRDIWVVGTYHKNKYLLSVNYVNGEGVSIAPSYEGILEYGETYSIPSPSLENYMPDSAVMNGEALSDPFVISGTMGDENLFVTVKYLYTNNKLVIMYLYPDGREIPGTRVDRTLGENEAYDVASPLVNGYTADTALKNGEVWGDPFRVNGTMEGSASAVVQIYYKANLYDIELEYRYDADEAYPRPDGTTLSFDLSGAVLDGEDSLKVQFGNIYGYNVTTDSYGLPTPVALGYEFVGWYTDPDFQNQVTDETAVEWPLITKLYAKWEPMKFNVSVRYLFEEGQYHAPDFSLLPEGVQVIDEDGDGVYDYYFQENTLYMGDTYVIGIPAMVGYTAYRDYGIPGAQVEIGDITQSVVGVNILYEITYEINSYTITFMATGGEGQQVEYPTHTSYEQNGVFDEETFLAEGTYEHAETVIYPDGSPNIVREFYTYVPRYWTDENGVAHPDDFVAECDLVIYAYYLAMENIAEVYTYDGTLLSYHYNLTEAAESALTQEATSASYAPVIKLRRNEDVVDKDIFVEETVVVQSDDDYHVKLDLSGISLCSDTDLFLVDEPVFYVYNSDTQNAASLNVAADGDVTAISLQGYAELYIGTTDSSTSSAGSYPVSISVSSQNGDAVGIRSTDYSTVFLGGGDFTVNAPSGDATGVLQEIEGDPVASSYYLITYSGVSAEAKNDATALRSNGTIEVRGTNVTNITAISADGTALGIEGGKRLNLVSNGVTNIYAESENGNAVGIRSTYELNAYKYKSVSEINTVTAISQNGNATGVDAYRVGDNINLDVTATAPQGTALGVRIETSNMIMTWDTYASVCATGKDAVGLDCAYNLYLKGYVEANGTESAVGVRNANQTVTVYDNASVSVNTEGGNAYAMQNCVLKTYSSATAASISANATTGNAYALYDVDTAGTFSPSLVIHAIAEEGSAYGYFVSADHTATMVDQTTISAISGNGCAYGVYNAGELLLLAGAINATSENGYAYGVVNAGGRIAATADGLIVTATSVTSDSYGIYCIGGTVGAENVDDAIRYGVITANAGDGGNGYALYAYGGTIYIRGSELLYKGSAEGNQRYGSVVICAGYAEFCKAEDDAQHPGYYYLEIRGTYTITFVSVDLYGNVLATYAPREYIIGEGFVLSQSLPQLPYAEGFTSQWDAFDFSAPSDMPSVPEAGTTYNKIVYSIYIRNSYTITFVYDDDSGQSETLEFLYEAEIVFPDMNGRTKYGHTFGDAWWSDSSRNTLFNLTQMPAYDLTIYAKWDKGTFTITFVTNTDEVIPPITGLYGDYFELPTPLRPGFSFEGWYPDNNDHSGSGYRGSITMPGENITLYAYWYESVSVIVMGEFKAYSIFFNLKMDINGDGVEEVIPLASLEDMLGEDEPIFVEGEISTTLMYSPWIFSLVPAEMLSQMNMSERMLIKGWYLDDDTPVNLASGIGSWGAVPDENGVIQVYTRLALLPGATSWTDMLYDEVEGVDKDVIPSIIMLLFGGTYEVGALGVVMENQDGGAGGYAYHTYKALTSGTHEIAMLNISITGSTAYQTYVYAVVHSPDGSTRVAYDGAIAHVYGDDALSNPNSLVKMYVPMETGETLVVRTHQLADGDGVRGSSQIIFAMHLPSKFPVLESMLEDPSEAFLYALMMHNGRDFFFYGSSMGTVQLPTHPDRGYDNVTSWQYVTGDGSLSADALITISPEMLNDSSYWVDFDGISAMVLFPVIGEVAEGDWQAYIEANRHFDPDVLSSTRLNVTIREHGAVSFIFATTSTDEHTEAVLNFKNGLPVGATLTLIDLSGEYPIYYYYIVSGSEALTGLSLTEFIKAGGSQAFGGYSPVMMFNVSYANTTHTLTSETVTLTIDGETLPNELRYTINRAQQTELMNTVVESGGKFGGDVMIPSLTGQGFGNDDHVIIEVRIEDEQGNTVPLPPALRCELEGMSMVNLGDFGALYLGTVSEFTSNRIASFELYFDVFRYAGFEGRMICDIVIVPEGIDLGDGSYRSVETFSRIAYILPVRVVETPPLVLETSDGKASTCVRPGDVVSVTVRVQGREQESLPIEVFIYQAVDGRMVATENGSSLFMYVGTDAYGQIQGEITTGTATLMVAEDAIPGYYYLVAYYNSQYVVYTVQVEGN